MKKVTVYEVAVYGMGFDDLATHSIEYMNRKDAVLEYADYKKRNISVLLSKNVYDCSEGDDPC